MRSLGGGATLQAGALESSMRRSWGIGGLVMTTLYMDATPIHDTANHTNPCGNLTGAQVREECHGLCVMLRLANSSHWSMNIVICASMVASALAWNIS